MHTHTHSQIHFYVFFYLIGSSQILATSLTQPPVLSLFLKFFKSYYTDNTPFCNEEKCSDVSVSA